MRRLLLTLGMACCCLWLQAQTLKKATEAESKTMVAAISKTAAAIRTLTCSFTQVKTLSLLNDKMTSQGRMRYDASGRLRWEYTSPYAYVITLDGRQLHIEGDGERKTVDIGQSGPLQGVVQVMTDCMTGKNLTSGKDFASEWFKDGDVWVAELVPRRKELKQLFSTIRLRFDSKRRTVSKVELKEKGGDMTVITLRDVRIEKGKK